MAKYAIEDHASKDAGMDNQQCRSVFLCPVFVLTDM